jgi:hypothetical protein
MSPCDPPIDDVENEDYPNDHPPRFAGSRGVLFGKVVSAFGTAVRILMNLASAIGARNGGLLVVVRCFIHVASPVLLVIVPIITTHDAVLRSAIILSFLSRTSSSAAATCGRDGSW